MMILMGTSIAIMFLFKSSRWFWAFFEIFMYSLTFYSFWFFFDSKGGFEFFSSMFMADWLTFMLILLTFFITALMLSGSYTSVLIPCKNSFLFIGLCFMMMFFLVLSFLSVSILNFYIFFEASLIPIFLLIMGWGYQPERLQASIYMLFYTLFASLPLLLVILLEYKNFKGFLIQSMDMSGASVLSYIFSFFLGFAFLVKLPMFGVHLWLPKAHVEAPVAGSMILAGVLLKLGSYGMWRIIQFVSKNFTEGASFYMVMGLLGGLIVSFVCTIQVDMKSLVAYSSVVHMGILLAGVSSLFNFGFEGALCMMLGHGLVSSGLFFLVGSMYDRLGSRSVLINKGLMVIFPFLTIFWFILCIFNISAPPSISLLSEILLTASILKWSVFTFLWLMMMNFMGMVYTFYMYAQSQQGKIFSSILSVHMISSREVMVSLLHSLSVLSLLGIFWLF